MLYALNKVQKSVYTLFNEVSSFDQSNIADKTFRYATKTTQ